MNANAPGYQAFYERFDTPLMRRVRRDAYGQDIGQHSWASAAEVEQAVEKLRLAKESVVLDLGCGPGGPLTFIASRVGCRAVGLDVSPAAIESARSRARSLAVEHLIEFAVADSNEPLAFPDGSFVAVLAIDVVLHLRDRLAWFREVARVLSRSGRFLFTDAAVLVTPISSDEVRHRSIHGFTQFAPHGYNESALAEAGLRLIERIDLTSGLLAVARGRHESRLAHRTELEQAETPEYFEQQLRYLQTVVELADRGSLGRFMYLSETDAT